MGAVPMKSFEEMEKEMVNEAPKTETPKIVAVDVTAQVGDRLLTEEEFQKRDEERAKIPLKMQCPHGVDTLVPCPKCVEELTAAPAGKEN